MASTVGRNVITNETVMDQADFFLSDGYTRVTGLTVTQLQSALFFGNLLQPWVLTDGTTITDAQVVAGKIYWNEIPGAPGYYSVRFRPNAVGFWRLVLMYPTGTQVQAQDYDVRETPPTIATGLKASFVQ